MRKQTTKGDSIWVGAQDSMLKALVGAGGLDFAPIWPKLPKNGSGSFTLTFFISAINVMRH